MSGHFQIKVKSASRWSFHSYKRSEGDAVNDARQILRQKIADEAKVVVAIGEGEERIVFHESQQSLQKKAGVALIEDSPVWSHVEDLYVDASVKTLTKLLRDYFDQEVISPTEFLHSQRKIQAFMDSSVCASALDRLASIQAVKAKENEEKRRDTIYEFFEEAQNIARLSPRDEIVNATLDQYLQDVGNFADPDIRYRINASIAQATLRSPSWEGKFAVLFDLLGDLPPEKLQENTVSLLDDMLSEMFCMPTVIQEMLGQQPDRYNAMDVLIKLCIGRYEARKWDTPSLRKISELMAHLPLSKCRTVLSERIEQMLRSRSALTKGDIHEEKHAFKQLVPLFIAKNGAILGGESMAEALAMCGTRSFNRDRNLEKPQDAINYIVETLEAPILQLRFLLVLSKSRFGQDCADIVCAFIPTFMDGPEHVHDIVHYKLPLKRKLRVITNLQKAALEISLPGDMNIKLVEWLDDLLYSYLDEERIIDKMDSPSETLFNRATALLQFCASGILIEGKTLNWVRERVQEHLRQPNFVEKFTEDVDTPKKKELVITQLHAMLKKAGLQQ